MRSRRPVWRFGRMSPSQINQDPVQGEFFTAAADLPERLVRESIQNSLDARRGTETVEVRFAFGRSGHSLTKRAAKPYVEGLERHLNALADARTAPGGSGGDEKEEEALFRAWELLEKPLEYLVVEDFGTTGLVGDPSANGEMESGNDFWGFFRSVGISPKSEDAAGSWGLGRWVFPDASGLNAYIGLTRSHDQETKLLMGLAMLKTHHVDDQKYPPYGFFAAFSDKDDDDWLPLPVATNGANGDFIERFENDFDLRRRDEPGLSIVVPHPHEDLTCKALERAVVTQYFRPILRGDLKVRIRNSVEEVLIDGSTLGSAVGRMRGGSDDESARAQRDDETPDALSKAIRLARWASDQEDHSEISFPVSRLRETIDALEVEELRSRYEANERLAFRLSTEVTRRKAARPEKASFRVYLERAEELSSGHSYFVRGHLRIPMAVSTGRFRQARALIVVDGDTELGHLLRDAEGPAHATWDPHAQRLKDRWSGGYARVQAVRAAAGLLLRRLARQSGRYPACRAVCWRLSLNGGEWSQPGNHLANWDAASLIRVRRTVKLDPVIAANDLGITPDEPSLSLEVRIGTGAGRLPRLILLRDCHELSAGEPQVEVDIEVAGDRLSLVLDLQTQVVLASTLTDYGPLSPRRAKDRVWSDTLRIRLEGEEPRFPIEIVDIRALLGNTIPPSTPWYLQWSPLDWDRDFHGAARLYLNKDQTDLIERIEQQDGPTLQVLLADVMSQICERLLTDSEAEEIMAGTEPNSLGGQATAWLHKAWPGKDAAFVRSLLDSRPGMFRAALLSLAEVGDE